MFNKFKNVWKQFTAKVDGNLALRSNEETKPDWNELDRTKQKLAKLRFKNGKSVSTSNLDISSVRERINQEVETGNCITVRQRDSQAIGKWFRNQEITDSGSFDTGELHKRIEEVQQAELEADPIELDSFPEMEDTFMAFSRPEEDLFDDEERITLSGVNYKVDPLEELEEEYTLPGIPMFDQDTPEVNELDIVTEADALAHQVFDKSQEIDFSPIEEDEEQKAQKSNTKEILATLEQRIQEGRIKDTFWVDSGS